ncbi:MAG: hypothetical protein JF585_05310 [Burkholderiales bacterium]|nr:hypothetical protein [Burkholderiales bacterium]
MRHVETPTDAGLPASAARALAQRFPYMHAIGHGAGHLQVDDADDLAVVLAPIGQAHDAVIALLVTGVNGDYRVAAVSKVVAPGCETCTTTADIAHHLLSVHVMKPADPEFERVTYQFGYRDTDDALRLVGVTAAQPPGDDPIAHGYAISTNLVTGAKVDTLDPTQSDPARRRQLRSTVPLRPAIAFDAFAFTTKALGPELRRQPATAFEQAESLPASAAALVHARFAGMAVQAQSSGALRSDGARDVAVVLAPPPGSDGETVLALLLAQSDGSLRLGATSGPLNRNCHDCEVQVQIAHKALVVQTTSSDSAGTHVVGYQFVATGRSGAPRLVGVRTVQASHDDSGDSHRYVNTANLVTGDKLDVIEDIVHGRRNRVERASKIAVRPPITLAGFVFDPAKLDAETRRDFTP